MASDGQQSKPPEYPDANMSLVPPPYTVNMAYEHQGKLRLFIDFTYISNTEYQNITVDLTIYLKLHVYSVFETLYQNFSIHVMRE